MARKTTKTSEQAPEAAQEPAVARPAHELAPEALDRARRLHEAAISGDMDLFYTVRDGA